MIVISFFRDLYNHIKYSHILNKVYKTENIIPNLSKLFGVNFKKDRIGRIYAVLNPNISNGVYNADDQIFEYGEDGLVNDQFVEHWVMDRLNAASQFIHNNNLFELLTYEIKRLDEYDNFLFILKPITLEDCLNSTKKFTILVLVIAIIAVVLKITLF